MQKILVEFLWVGGTVFWNREKEEIGKKQENCKTCFPWRGARGALSEISDLVTETLAAFKVIFHGPPPVSASIKLCYLSTAVHLLF